MRFLSFLIWIFLYVDQIENIECAVTVKSNIKTNNDPYEFWNMSEIPSKRYCSLECNQQSDRTIVVQTANDNGTHINVPVQDDLMALVYYNCPHTIINGGPMRHQYHTFQKLCDSQFEKCTNYSDSYKESWNSLKKEVTPKLTVDLRLPSDLKHIKIRTEKCGRDRIIFTFKVDNKPIDYRQERNDYNYTNDNFFANNLQKTPIALEIKIFPENVLAVITFNFTKTGTISCARFNQIHCNVSCKNLLENTKRKCYFRVKSRILQILKSPEACSTTGWDSNAPKEMVYVGACMYFDRRNIRLCKHDCIDLPNCSYMCAQRENNQRYNESGYYFRKDYSGILGTRAWTWNTLPSNIVLINECSELTGLCQSPESCEDLDIGYRCKMNDYNNFTCLKREKNRFFNCLHDKSTFVSNKEFPATFRGSREFLREVRDSELPIKYKLMKIFNWTFTVESTLGTKSNMTVTRWKWIFRYTLDIIISIFEKHMKQLLKESAKARNETQAGVYSYIRPINKTVKVVDIPLPESNNTKNNEFVKLKINQSQDFGNDSAVTFVYFKDKDLARESNQLKQKANLYGVSPSGNQSNVQRFKNSNVISVIFNETTNITIQFKLQRLQKVEPPNWLYTVEEECGYLEKEWTWSVDGCRKVKQGEHEYCECDHLSNFAMLFSMRMVNDIHLIVFKYLSILGSIINVLSLLLFLVFVLFINSRDKMRIDYLNIAICLLMGTLVFVFGGLFVEHTIPCKIAALLTQYLFLSAFAWMLILAINVIRIASWNYQTEDWMVKYRLVIWAVGYMVSLLIVVLSGSFNWAQYGRVSDNVCWIDNRQYALLSFIIPVGIVIAINVIVLFYIANTLIRNYINTRKIKVNESSELLAFIQLLVTMGFTWFPSYFATYYLSAMYMLVIFFPLQGLMMFLCVVVINKENRDKVSSYVLLRYSYFISKSTATSGVKSNSKSKSSSNSKNTEQNQSLLSDTEKEKEASKNTKESSIPLTTIRDPENTVSLHHPEC